MDQPHSHRRRRIIPAMIMASIGLLAGLAACERTPAPPPSPAAPQQATAPAAVQAPWVPSLPPQTLEPQTCGSIARLHVLGDFYLAAQPSAQDFALLKERGVKSVINLREPSEQKDFDEKKIVSDLGLQYHPLPFRSPESLTDEIFDQARKILSEKESGPILIHCAGANRVGAIWLVKRALDDGILPAQALEEAHQIGLTNKAYEEKAMDYIRRKAIR